MWAANAAPRPRTVARGAADKQQPAAQMRVLVELPARERNALLDGNHLLGGGSPIGALRRRSLNYCF